MSTGRWWVWGYNRRQGNGSYRGFGEELLAEAIKMAGQAGFSKLAVISGIGVRPYYRKLGFERDGPYMSRFI